MARQSELGELNRLRNTVPNVSLGARNFISWQCNIRDDKNARGVTNFPTTRSHTIAGTVLYGHRLRYQAKEILVGLIGVFFEMFKDGKAPANNITIYDVYFQPTGMLVWLSNLAVRDLDDNPQTWIDALDNLIDLIRTFVGNNVPEDLNHLLHCLEEYKTNNNMKNVILVHPSLLQTDVRCSLIEHLCAVYKGFRDNGMIGEANTFRGIAAGIDGIAATDHCQTRVLGHSPEWDFTWNETIHLMEKPDRVDVASPIFILIFIRHALNHHMYPLDYQGGRFVDPKTIEDDLYVLFPNFLCEFMNSMISHNQFPEIWSNILR